MSFIRPGLAKSFNRFMPTLSSQTSMFTRNTLYQSTIRNSSSYIVGIDLGTTNSAVSVFEGTQAKIIENREGQRTTPSVVAFSSNKEGATDRLVGMSAKRQAVTNPQNTFYATKRLIGRRFEDDASKDIQKNLSYEVVRGDNGDSWVYSPLTKKKYSPSQIGSYILQKMKETAEDYLGEKVTQAVITVPAYFNESQRRATKDAGQIAGLDVKRVINEPTAAAMAYGMGEEGKGANEKKDGLVAVYDLGGGTFDISILELSGGVFEVKATNGDTQLGGEDFDHLLLEHITQEFKKDQQVDLMKDPLAVQRLKDIAEKAKIELSSTNTTNLSAPFITADNSGPKHLDMELPRSKLEQLVDKLIQRTLGPCEQALKDADLKKTELTDVILVGGMTRMPKVQSVVEKFFGRQPSKSVNPDEVVAMGAAIQGGVLQGKVGGIVLIDVTPLSLGIETLGGIFTKLIEKNTPIPTKKTETFSTASDNQTQVGIKVFQGEREMAVDNKFLGHFDLVGIPPAPRGRPQIEVAFDIDANGILNVGAKDKGTGKDQNMQIQTSGGLSKEEIKKMQDEAEKMADQDKAKREIAEQKNTADNLVFQAESQIEEFKDKITHETKENIEEQMQHLRQLRSNDGTSLEDLKEGCEKLTKALSQIGEQIYGSQSPNDQSQSQENQNENQNENQDQQQGQDVEGEYKEK